jgi:hypothetical protein
MDAEDFILLRKATCPMPARSLARFLGKVQAPIPIGWALCSRQQSLSAEEGVDRAERSTASIHRLPFS